MCGTHRPLRNQPPGFSRSSPASFRADRAIPSPGNRSYADAAGASGCQMQPSRFAAGDCRNRSQNRRPPLFRGQVVLFGSDASPAASLFRRLLVADMVRVYGNEMADFRGAMYMKAIDRILNKAIGVGDALMLAQMLDPGFH